MVDIIDFKTSIYDELSSVMTIYEVNQVPKEALMPYATYSLTTSTEGIVDDTESVDFILEINILDHNKQKNTDVIELLTNQVDKALNRKNIIETAFYWYAIRQIVNVDLPTTDEFTLRRELTYLLKTYSEV